MMEFFMAVYMTMSSTIEKVSTLADSVPYRCTAYSKGTIGASGRTLIPNYSVATCDCIPLGTLLYIEDFGIVRVDDRMAESHYVEEHNHHVLDLYLDSYDSACQWGAQWREVIIYETIRE